MKARGQSLLNEDLWPDLADFLAYVTFAIKRPATALKLEAYQGNGDAGDWIGIRGYLARFDASGTARPSKWPHPAHDSCVHPGRAFTAFRSAARLAYEAFELMSLARSMSHGSSHVVSAGDIMMHAHTTLDPSGTVLVFQTAAECLRQSCHYGWASKPGALTVCMW